MTRRPYRGDELARRFEQFETDSERRAEAESLPWARRKRKPRWSQPWLALANDGYSWAVIGRLLGSGTAMGSAVSRRAPAGSEARPRSSRRVTG